MARKGIIFDALTGSAEKIAPKGDQPAYTRGRHNWQTSSKLTSYRACVAEKMSGKTFADRASVKKAFTEAAKACKGSRSEAPKKIRRLH